MIPEAVYGLGKDFIFRKAVDYLRSRKVLSPKDFKRLAEDAQADAFTVSGYTALGVIARFRDSLADAVEAGQTKEEWQEGLTGWLGENGYEGPNPWHMNVIYRTNVQTAYNAGHYYSMQSAKRLRPFWQYMTADDGNVRESHAAMHGRVYAADDPIWGIWYPPNGFQCRCTVVSLTAAEVERKGLVVETDLPITIEPGAGIVPAFPDKGFSRNPAIGAAEPPRNQLPEDLARIWDELKTGWQRQRRR